MANKQKEYDRGRADGLMFAYRLVKEGGEKALADHIRLRGYFGGKISPFTAEEIDDMARQIKELTTTGLRVAMIAVLRDEFGFGKVRVQRFVDAFDKFSDYLGHGWMDFMDIIKQLEEQLDLHFDDRVYKYALSYVRPDCADVYTPDDFISPAEWSKLLQDLDYTDWQDPTTPSKHYIRTADGSQLLCEYDGQYEQVRLYDFLDGMRYERQIQNVSTRAVSNG